MKSKKIFNAIVAALIAVNFSALAGCVGAQTGGVLGGFVEGRDIQWTLVTQSGIPDFVESVAYGNGRFVAIGTSATGGRWFTKIVYSTDGITWTRIETSIFNRQDTRGPAYGNGKFVVVTYGGQIMYATDGVTWTGFEFDVTEISISSIAYGAGRFVVVGSAGELLPNDGGRSSSDGMIAYSNVQE